MLSTRLVLVYVFVCIFVITLATCGKDSPTKPEPKPPEPPPVSLVATRIEITPSQGALDAIGKSVQLTARVFDQNNALLTSAVVTWTSSNTGVATVSNQGLVIAVGNGTTRITAKSGNASTGIDISVMQTVGSVAIQPDSATLMSIGATVQLTARVLDTNGQRVAGAVVAWSSSDTTVATVTNQGLVKAVGTGTALITAKFNNASDSAPVEVMLPNPDRAALIAFYNATNGPNWSNNQHWSSDSPLNDWYGVSADEQDRVTALDLNANNLRGSVPQILSELRQLRKLILTGNNGLIGPLARLLTGLSLDELDLDGTNLCVPSDIEYQGWFGRIPDAQAATCVNDPLELEALVALYNQTDGSNWSQNTNWMTNTPLGSWFGIESDASGRVEYLELQNNNLEGSLPAEIGQLSSLIWIDLASNKLSGTLPAEMGRLSKLAVLNVHANQLSGSIPPELGRIELLSTLRLSHNQFSGRIPSELGQLRILRNLYIGFNRITGTLPQELGKLIELDVLSLAGNAITGAIPPELARAKNVRLLFLDRNQLTGNIPPEIGHMNSLETLRLHNNKLSGPIPSEFGNLLDLRSLDVSVNPSLTGPLPRTLTNLSIDRMDLQDTRLCVPIDEEFQVWFSGISRIQAARCGDTGKAALAELFNQAGGPNWVNAANWLSDRPLNQWHGVAADQSGLVTALDLENNNLNGSIPSTLSILGDLNSLNLSRNSGLTGPLPRSLLQLDLETLNLTGTELCAPTDVEFRAWVSAIADAQVAECTISDPERDILVALYHSTDGPNWHNNANWLSNEPIGKWHGVQAGTDGRVKQLALNDNNLTGPLPSELGQLERLTDLVMFNNRISGVIPPDIGQLARLRRLFLESNGMSGPIPPELGQLENLVLLHLFNNELSGSIPPELGRLEALTDLSLSNNNLTGSIPHQLGQLKNLVLLSLSNNNLTGSIPHQLGQLSNLVTFYAFNNKLTGQIPSDLGNLSDLLRFSLSSNELSGDIPPELGRLNDVLGMSLSNNRLTGQIPAELVNLPRLVHLHLDNNQLSGIIPSEIGRLDRLADLRLNDNELSGTVPQEIGGLTLLKTLNLENNTDLTGPLPVTLANLSLEGLIVEGTGLCAPPDRDFQSWMQNLLFIRVPDCVRVDGTLVYLTQAIQSSDYPVPLVAGDDALLRIFVTNGTDNEIDMPPVRATFYHDDFPVDSVFVPGESTPVPMEISEGSLSSSVNVVIPGQVIQPGLEVVVEIDSDDTQNTASGLQERVPAAGRLSVDVREVPHLDLTVVPLLWEENPDRSILGEAENLSEEDDLFWPTRNLLPVGEFAVTMHEPVLTSVDPVFRNHGRILHELEMIRVMEGGHGRYMGVLTSQGGGATTIGGRTMVSDLDGFVIAHEFGHTMGLFHAPCNTGGLFTDGNFPYENGSIGVWGYDIRDHTLVPPETKDLMGYCDPLWISDYNFLRALNYRLNEEAVPEISPRAAAGRSLLLWGRRDQYGELYLEPAFVVDAQSFLPRSSGPYRLTGEDGRGSTLFALEFAMNEFADDEGGTFAFVVPAHAGWSTDLERISLEGPEGVVTTDDSSDRYVSLLLDRYSGSVRGVLREWNDSMFSATAVRRVAPEPDLEISISNGIPDPDSW